MIEGLEVELRAALVERAEDVPADVQERLRRIDYRPRSRSLSPRMALAAGTGLAATSGAIVAIVGLGAGTSPAFAGWSATPTKPASGQTAGAQERCTSQLAAAGGAPSNIPATGWQPVVTDTRGPFTLMIMRSGSANATCFSGPSFTTVAANSTQAGGGASEHALSVNAGVGGPQSSTSVMGPGGEGSGPIGPATQSHLTTSGGQPYTFVQGQVVPGVTDVTLMRSGGGSVRATVADGSFAAWWPGSANPTSAQVASAAGVGTQQLNFQRHLVTARHRSQALPQTQVVRPRGSGSLGGSEVGPDAQRPRAAK
jgi:hypothetical protein